MYVCCTFIHEMYGVHKHTCVHVCMQSAILYPSFRAEIFAQSLPYRALYGRKGLLVRGGGNVLKRRPGFGFMDEERRWAGGRGRGHINEEVKNRKNYIAIDEYNDR